jgi:hypothetical protein
MFQQSGQAGGRHFEVYKGLAIASAVVDTYAAANAAFRSLSGIPVVGPALGAAAAAAAVVSGIANVNRIRSMQPGGSGGSSGGGGRSGGTRSASSVAAGLSLSPGPAGASRPGNAQSTAAPVVNVAPPQTVVEIHADPRGLYSVTRTGETQLTRRHGRGDRRE